MVVPLGWLLEVVIYCISLIENTIIIYTLLKISKGKIPFWPRCPICCFGQGIPLGIHMPSDAHNWPLWVFCRSIGVFLLVPYFKSLREAPRRSKVFLEVLTAQDGPITLHCLAIVPSGFYPVGHSPKVDRDGYTLYPPRIHLKAAVTLGLYPQVPLPLLQVRYSYTGNKNYRRDPFSPAAIRLRGHTRSALMRKTQRFARR